MIAPIWKDFYVTLDHDGAVSSADYAIEDGAGHVLYTGRAYTRPGDTYPVIRVNDIMADYLRRGITFVGDTDTAMVTFEVVVGEDNYGENILTADWSYDPDFDADNLGLNFPICDILLPGQLVPCTLGTSGEGTASFVLYLAGGGDFNADFNSDFLIEGDDTETGSITAEAFGTAWLDLTEYATATRLEYTDDETGKVHTYRIGGGCNQFALYYVNAYGGWDTLAVLGATKVRDELTRHTLRRDYDNTQTHNRGTVNYANEYTRAFSFHTHPLTAEQGARMHHLLNSPHVYLHDTQTGHIWPIVLTGNTTEHKTGHGLHEYTIEAELAQERERR